MMQIYIHHMETKCLPEIPKDTLQESRVELRFELLFLLCKSVVQTTGSFESKLSEREKFSLKTFPVILKILIIVWSSLVCWKIHLMLRWDAVTVPWNWVYWKTFLWLFPFRMLLMLQDLDCWSTSGCLKIFWKCACACVKLIFYYKLNHYSLRASKIAAGSDSTSCCATHQQSKI